MGKIVNLVFPKIASTTKMGYQTDTSISSGTSLAEKRETEEKQRQQNQNTVVNADNTNYDKRYITFVPQILSASDAVSGIVNNLTNAATSAVDLDIVKIFKNLESSVENAINLVSYLTDFTPRGFLNRLTTKLSDDISAVYIALPAKSAKVSLAPSWKANDTFQGSIKGGAKGVVKNLVGNAMQKGIAAAMEKWPSINSFVSQMGVNTYTPQRQFFEGCQAISFDFAWTLQPRNKEEADIIKKIVTTFKYLSVPQSLDGERQENQPVYLSKMPAIWRIDFDNGDAFKDMMVKNNSFPAMVCTKCDVTYGKEEEFWTTFPDGFPNVITLEMAFTQMFPFQAAQDVFGIDTLNNVLKTKS